MLKSKNTSNERRTEIRREYRSTIHRTKRLHYQNIANINLKDMYSSIPADWKSKWKHATNAHHINLKSFEDFHKANITLTRNREFGNEFMDKISYMIDKREPDHNSNDHDIINDIVDQPRSANDSTLAICEAKLGKASVIDMIPVEFYKLGGETIFNTMLAIFNSVLQSRDYLQAWVDGIINPIYKM